MVVRSFLRRHSRPPVVRKEEAGPSVRNVGIPEGLVDLIDVLQKFPQLGITSRNAFVTSAVRDRIDANVKKLVELRDLGLLTGADLDAFRSWKRPKA